MEAGAGRGLAGDLLVANSRAASALATTFVR
jgi:hypothetical protein